MHSSLCVDMCHVLKLVHCEIVEFMPALTDCGVGLVHCSFCMDMCHVLRLVHCQSLVEFVHCNA